MREGRWGTSERSPRMRLSCISWPSQGPSAVLFPTFSWNLLLRDQLLPNGETRESVVKSKVKSWPSSKARYSQVWLGRMDVWGKDPLLTLQPVFSKPCWPCFEMFRACLVVACDLLPETSVVILALLGPSFIKSAFIILRIMPESQICPKCQACCSFCLQAYRWQHLRGPLPLVFWTEVICTTPRSVHLN